MQKIVASSLLLLACTCLLLASAAAQKPGSGDLPATVTIEGFGVDTAPTLRIQSDGKGVYTIHFYDRGIPGKLPSGCTCPAGDRGLVCCHVAGAAAVHLGIESMRRAA
jgi:hypothetical protein